MDEPSAVLAHDEVENLFRLVGELTRDGVAVVYISHRLEEIRRIGDVVTVLKDGRTVATGLPARTTPTARRRPLMTGRTVEYVFPPRRAAPAPDARRGAAGRGPVARRRLPRRRPDGARRRDRRHRGAGRLGTFGDPRDDLRRAAADGGPGRRRRPRARARAGRARRCAPGSALAPEERKAQALLLDQSVTRNVSLATLSRFARVGWLDRRREERGRGEQIDAQLDVRPADPSRPVRTLSGGNQQKVVVGAVAARLDQGPAARRADPRRRRRRALRALHRRSAGSRTPASASSWSPARCPRCSGLADRVLVLREGRVVHEAPAEELEESTVLDLVMEGSAA